MQYFPPTVIIRHVKENLKKCTLRGLEERPDFLFFSYPLKTEPPLEDYILLTVEAPELSYHDQYIPNQLEELEFWQSRCHRVGAVEAAHGIAMGDANGFKSGNGGEAKNPFFKLIGYRGLVILDATWRYAKMMERTISFPSTVIRRSLPKSLRTAYPRRQADCPDPKRGLASIESIMVAYTLMGRRADELLKNYYWKELFLENNSHWFLNSN